jgi:hypothetical protein
MTFKIFISSIALIFLSGCDFLFVQKVHLIPTNSKPISLNQVPSLTSKIQPFQAAIFYQVKSGDTLWAISKKIYGSNRKIHDLVVWNHLKNPNWILAGSILQLKFNSLIQVAKAKVYFASLPSKALKSVELLKKVDQKWVNRPIKNNAFSVGEYLKFEIRYFNIIGGYATLKIPRMIEYHHRPCYELEATAKAAFPFSEFYGVHDYMKSWFDAVNFIPWKFEKHTHEGHFKQDYTIQFHQLSHQAILIQPHHPNQIISTMPFIQDILSSFYYFRLLKMHIGETIDIPTDAKNKCYELVVRIVKKSIIQVKAGKFHCFLVQPRVKYDNVFRNKGTIDLWITDNAYHIPVLIQSHIAIGSIDVELIAARLPSQCSPRRRR